MTREELREMTMQLIFQMEATGSFDPDKLSVMVEDSRAIKRKQVRRTLDLIHENIDTLDAVISDNLDKWSIDRLPKVELAILRLAVCEILYLDEIPAAVSINEAVELAKEYGDERSYAFINSVLGKIERSLDE